jgi:protein-S-isoprenylcysteine O-methyltransferase Ste14
MSVRKAWIDILYTAATGTRRIRTLLTPVGLIVFGAFTALFVYTALLADRFFGLPGLLPEGARLTVSTPLLVIGTGLTAWSAVHFLRVKGTPVPLSPPPTLVTTGPYRYARNPMLTGVFLILFGIGIAVGSLSLVFVFTPLYVLAHLWELKRIEEPELAQRLGEEYLEYRSRTPMFIPRVKREVRNDGPSTGRRWSR